MSNQDQLKMHSPNLVDTNIEKIAALFPNCVTETQGENGELKKAIDFDLLKQELSQVIVAGEQERYRLDWVGKKESILTANAPIAKTLRPCREESVNFDTTENLFIEGDNLEALKLLQENYLGKVKMIYIDPPYNTGNDFIYEDDFAESTNDFFERSNQTDDEGNKLVANTDSNGRFHSDWLSMMYSRLKLARNLLKDDGVIFISIDDNEQDNLRKILDEVFGRNNFVANLIWEKKFAPQNDAKWFSENHDHILCYAKNKNELSIKLLPRTSEMNERYKNYDNDPRGVWISDNLLRKDLQKTGVYTITTPNGNKYDPPSGRSWRVSESKFHEMAKDNRIWFGSDGGNVPRIKRFLTEVQDGIKSQTIWKFNEVGHNQEASQELRKLFDGESYFDTPKPVRLLSRIIFLSTHKDDIVLDFFAGSSTTAHAVMQINAEDGCDRKFIMVQLPEQTDEKSDAYKAGYNTIAEISKERIRRAGKKILEDNTDKEGIENLDIGFRVLKIDSTNMKDVYYTPDAYKQVDILDLADHIKEDRTSEDLLFQVMLDWGLELSLPIERKIIQGKEVFYVAGNSLVACFEEINFAMVDEIAQDKPLRVVSAERAIQLDHDKTNIKERFKQLSPETEVKFI
ncbi:TPA: site-specific DNA-methyltransferase [Acinetobacter baumannii]|uniref:site-specific DNA-methyltransferase n=2 Tax=Acinetobacter baumannii TaxID=470 RepID=UPI00292AEE27|nr:site-specific DNA-methyltransferase [Acinetobacter baumannii]HEC0902625.1 site-specific DNA-methyltransferase [Acinetobacter baumannii]